MDKENQSCFLVIARSYTDETSAKAFWTEEKSHASIEQDAEVVIAELNKQGYSPRKVIMIGGDVMVYVPDSGIYYEWCVIPTRIE